MSTMSSPVLQHKTLLKSSPYNSHDNLYISVKFFIYDDDDDHTMTIRSDDSFWTIDFSFIFQYLRNKYVYHFIIISLSASFYPGIHIIWYFCHILMNFVVCYCCYMSSDRQEKKSATDIW